VIERLSRVLGREVRTLTRVQSSGYTVAYHAIAELDDGTTAFVKAATEPVTAEFIRDEQRVFRALSGPFMPALLGLDEADPEPLDVAAWLPSLRLEGGPEPDEILPDAGGFAALLAGFFGCRAGLPAPPTAPQVRPFQLAQLRVSLPWAVRELGLEPPG
jgi:hypothetical protein